MIQRIYKFNWSKSVRIIKVKNLNEKMKGKLEFINMEH